MKKDYEKAFQLMRETVENIEQEEQILIDRLNYIKYFINKWGHERPNGKQEIGCFKVLDVLNDIIDGKIIIEEI